MHKTFFVPRVFLICRTNMSTLSVQAKLNLWGWKGVPKTCMWNRWSSGRLSWRVVQTKPFSSSLLKQAKHELMSVHSLSKYNYSRRVHLIFFVLSPLVMWKESRPLPFPQSSCGHARAFSSCPCFQVHSVATVNAILSRRPPYRKNILHSASSTVLSFLTQAPTVPQLCFEWHAMPSSILSLLIPDMAFLCELLIYFIAIG